MSSMYGIRRYAIEGENARKVYDAVSDSYFFRNYSECLKMEYRDGVLFIDEEWGNYPQFGDFVLPFLIGDDFYWLDCRDDEDKWSTNDKEGRYFKIDA